MADTFSDSWSWSDEDERAGSTETTPGGSESVEWVVVATSVNPGEANIIKARLESEGIAAIVQQEAMGSVLGLTVGPLGLADVLVPASLAEQALEILAETFESDQSDEV